ncbi:NfeD family protein [Caldimonas sp. KR1-144]|uniref:NfeD family protein n=1 Tax=Caldimonas sp. KR1-144 TaxID=3400911 RepID=UPI003BFABD2A
MTHAQAHRSAAVRLPALAVAFVAALVLALAASATSAAPVFVLELHDAIGPASADYTVRGLAKAAKAGAPLVVIEIDTPGGLDTSMRQIIQAILASPVPVAVYVSPEGARAASAGTYILYAAHVAAMAPSTTLGAATPVAIGMPGGGEKPPAASAPASAPADAMTAKQVNDAAAFIRGLAQQRGRNAEWAERAVREAVSLTANEALRERVIDVVAADLPDLLAKLDGRSVRVHGQEARLALKGLPIELLRPDWRQRLLAVITHPSVALILMMLGIYGLLFEFSSPGTVLPGTVGAICLLLALFALQLLPVNYAGLGLIVLGIALLIGELMAPSFGVLGIGGIVAFVAGGLLLFDSDVPGFGAPVALIVSLAVTSAALVLLGGGMVLRARKRPVVSGREALLGSVGEVLALQDGQAWAQVHGERWRVSSGVPLAPGQRVRVVAVRGLTLDVQIEPAEQREQGARP